MRVSLAAAALRSLAPRGVGAARFLSAKPPAPPTPAELEKMYKTSEAAVKEIKEGTHQTGEGLAHVCTCCYIVGLECPVMLRLT
jgi:hypothetical protein